MKSHARERRKADLHLHSTCSDGLWPPARVVEKAARAGISVLSLTDHDSVEGIPEAAAAARELGVELIPGAEISVDLPSGGERHMLAYGFDTADAPLAAALAENVAARTTRLDGMLAALRREGIHLEPADVLAEAGGNVGRPHVADALVRKGIVRRRQEAFDRWLGDGRPAHVKKRNVDSGRAIALVHAAGGIAVLAHPGRRWDPLAIEEMVRAGLDGLECWHPSHGGSQVKAVLEMTQRWNLVATGGSDCHGDEEGEQNLHASSVPLSAAERVLERVAIRAHGSRAPRA